MAKTQAKKVDIRDRARPLVGQKAMEIQAYGTIVKLPIALSEKTCAQSVENLNQVLADTITLRDLYKKHHWQVAGPTFYQLHLLFDKHYEEQNELVDAIAERIQLLGGVSLAMAADVAETTLIPRPPRGREEVPVQISRLLHAHEIILEEARSMAAPPTSRRRRHQRPAGERRDPDQRAAGLVRRRARRGRAARQGRLRPGPPGPPQGPSTRTALAPGKAKSRQGQKPNRESVAASSGCFSRSPA